jgi:hypothetical protein
MLFSTQMESLVSRVTAKYRKTLPARGPDTAVVPQEPDSGYSPGALPLGNDVTSYEVYAALVRVLRSRKGMKDEYDNMDEECPEFSAAMDIFADNATRGSSEGQPSIVIRSEDARVVRILTDVTKHLKLEKILWTLARDIAKYGERAEEIIVKELPSRKLVIDRLKPLPTHYILPQVDAYGLPQSNAFVQVNDEGKEIAAFKEWQVLFFANKKSRADLTGRGFGFAARKPFKQVRLMEDAIVIARLTRAHNRLLFLLDTEGMTPKEKQKYVEAAKFKMRRRKMVDPITGRMNLDYNPLSTDEDIFLATSKESRADVKTLMGDLTIGNIDDLAYFQQKIFTALKVPKTYLAHDKETRTRAVITEQDIQFARSVRRLQYLIQDGLEKLYNFALRLEGIDPETVSYEVGLPPISVVDELRKWQTMQLKMLVAQMFKQTFWPSDEWLFRHLLAFSASDTELLLAGQNAPDQYNGLYQAPKVGTVSKTAEDFNRVLSALLEEDPEKYTKITQAIADLEMLTAWQLEGSR